VLGGAVASAINAALVLGAEAWHAGDWDGAVSVSQEALQLCEELGYDLLRWPLLLNLGSVAAARGDDEALRATVAEMDAWAAPRGVGAVSLYARHLGCWTPSDEPTTRWRSTRRRPSAVRASSSAARPTCSGPRWTGWRRPRPRTVAPPPSSTSRPCRRRDHRSCTTAHPAHPAAVALVAAPEAAGDRFEQALAVSDVRRWPFDSARVRLLYGERLRGAQRYAEAEAQLRAAAGRLPGPRRPALGGPGDRGTARAAPLLDAVPRPARPGWGRRRTRGRPVVVPALRRRPVSRPGRPPG
jgi:hypothetical protein